MMIDSEIGFSMEHFHFIQSRTLRRNNDDRCSSLLYGCSKNELKLENDKAGVDHKKLQNRNIVKQLISRERGLGKHNVSSYYAVRNFHKNIVPNCSLPQITVPKNIYFKKFSLDGKYLIGFPDTHNSVAIFEYQGPSASESLLRTMSQKPSLYIYELNRMRQQMFNTIFRKKHHVEVMPRSFKYLHKECLLFTEDYKYMLIASYSNVDAGDYAQSFNTFRNNESFSPDPISFLENYTLYIIDIEKGIVCDSQSFKSDKIYLAHNQGLYLYHNILSVLSVMHQTIHVFKITKKGRFDKVRCIGRFCRNDTYIPFNVQYPEEDLRGYLPYQEAFFTTMRQKIMIFLYKKFAKASLDEGSNEPLMKFYEQFDDYLALKMWKIQMLDKKHLLIKYSIKEYMLFPIANPTEPPPIYFAVYNMVTSKVVNFYDGHSIELLKVYDSFPDHFRNVSLHTPSQLFSSVSHDVHAKFLQNKFLSSTKQFFYPDKPVRYLLSELPISSQCHSPSPYLDSSLFRYDRNAVSTKEKYIAFKNHPIKFYDRDSGLLLYEINTKCQCNSVPEPCKRVIYFIFHPSDPLIISIQKSNSVMVVNIHLRHVFL